MTNSVNNQNTKEQKEIFNALWKNKTFILTFLLAGLILSIFLLKLKVYKNPIKYRYQAKVTLELVNGEGMKNQPQTLLYIIESDSILESALKKKNIENGDYFIKTVHSTVPYQYEIIAEGPNRENVVALVNEVVTQARTMASTALKMEKNIIIEKGRIFGSPIKIEQEVDIVLYILIGLIISFITSVFLIFFIRYVNGRIHSKNEAESILQANVLIEIPSRKKEKNLRNFFLVR